MKKWKIVIILSVLLLLSLLFILSLRKNNLISSYKPNILRLDYSPDGKYISILLPDSIYIIDSKNYSVVRVLEGQGVSSHNLLNVVWMSNSKNLITVQMEGNGCKITSYPNENYCIELWSVDNNYSTKVLKKFRLYQASASGPSIKISNDDKNIALSYSSYIEEKEDYQDGIYIINLINSNLSYDIQLDSTLETTILFSPDEKYLKLEQQDTHDENRITFYSTSNYEPVYSINFTQQDNERFYDLSWSKDGKKMVGAKPYKRIVYFDFLESNNTIELKPVEEFKTNLSEYDADAIDFAKPSPDFRYVAVSGTYSSKTYIAVFDKEKKGIVFFDWGGAFYEINDVGFDWSPDSKTLAYIFDGEQNMNVLSIDKLSVKRISSGGSSFDPFSMNR